MSLFNKVFDTVLEAGENTDDTAAAAVAAPQNDRAAMAQTLKNSAPEDYDIKGRETVVDQNKQHQLQSLKGWIEQIDVFIKFLNGTDSDSIQVQLHAAPCDSIFEDMARSEKKKIARLAAELSSLSESMKGYLISANDR